MFLSYNYARQKRWQLEMKKPPSQAISMAMAVLRYNTAHITRWRRSSAFIKATKCRHQVSTRSENINQTCLPLIVGVYFIVKSLKKSSSCPNNNRGVTHQTDEKHLNNIVEYFVGVVKQLNKYWRSWASTIYWASLVISNFTHFCPLLAFYG